MKIRVDGFGFVWGGDFRLPVKYDPSRKVLIFYDKDKKRSEERGTDQVEIPLALFAVDLVSIAVDDLDGSSGG